MMMTMNYMADIIILSDEEQDFLDSEEDHTTTGESICGNRN